MVTATALAAITDGLGNYRNPVIRAVTANEILNMGKVLVSARREAVLELRGKGWGWTRIGKVLGVSRQRAWNIGRG